MTPFQQKIYNDYLRISRTARGQQWRPRKDFSDIDASNTLHCARLERFFQKFPQINPEDFFLAPYLIYPDEKNIGLDFFTTQKAINTYSIYNKQKEQESPDAPDQLEFILNSAKFIGNFCAENKLQLSDYIDHKIGISYAFTIHYKNKKVSIYSLLYFQKFEKNVYLLEPDERMLFFNSSSPDFTKFKTRFIISTKAKSLIQTAFKRIDSYLKNLVSSH
jgi:hypothetical protein